MKKILLASLMLALGGLFFGGSGVFADEERPMTTMTISPPQQKIVLVPGEKFEGSIEVSNSINSPSDLKYSVTIGSFGLGKDENGNVDYNDTDVDTVTGFNQMMEWITLGKTEGTVKPNDVDIVPYTINVPANAPAGGQYATIIIQKDNDDDQGEGKGVAIKETIRFASSIFAEVAGETKKDGVIIENNIPAFMLSNPLRTSSIVRNNGNVHTDAKYTLQVWPLFSDEEICTNEEEPATSLIMPETERIHIEECNNLPSFGIFRVKQTVKIFGETSVAEKVVVVCPLWLLFIIIFAIVSLVIWIVMKSRARKTRTKEQAKPSVA